MAQGETDEAGRGGKGAQLEKRLEQEQMVKGALQQFLEPQAYERLMIVASQNGELYSKAAQWIITMARQGALRSKVNDEDMKRILLKVSAPARRETRIEFRRKGE
jgi:DNA-binding TFAR19-related protein (PDSD5 family)